MKKILLLLNVFALALLVACNPNEYATFNDDDAFVAFDGKSYSISEQGGSLKVPVTLASVKGISTTVSVNAVDGTAKNGVNYRIKNAALNFDATNRTAYVEIEVVNNPGVFTGDLKFTLTFGDLGGVNAGNNSSVSVTIGDEDHPLSAILGAYSATAADYFAGGAAASWTATLEKDADDISMVWISDFAGAAIGGHAPFYGVVNADMTEIAVPIGQDSGFAFTGGIAVLLYGFDPTSGNLQDAGNIILKVDAANGTITCDGFAVGNTSLGFAGVYYNCSFTK